MAGAVKKGVRTRITEKGVIQELSDNPQLTIQFPGYNPVLSLDQLATSSVITQATWYVDPVNGSDRNSGVSSGSALQTWGEFIRRWGPMPIISSGVTVNVLNDIPSTDRIYLNSYNNFRFDGTLFVKGTQTVLATMTVNSASVIDRTSADAAQYVSASSNLGAFVGKGAKIVGGPRDGAFAWIAKDMGSGRVRTSPFMQISDNILGGAANSQKVSPQVGDTIKVVQLTQVNNPLAVYDSPGAFCFQDFSFLDDSAFTGHYSAINNNNLPTFNRCSFNSSYYMQGSSFGFYNACSFFNAIINNPCTPVFVASLFTGEVLGQGIIGIDSIFQGSSAFLYLQTFRCLTKLDDVHFYDTNFPIRIEDNGRIQVAPYFASGLGGLYGTNNTGILYDVRYGGVMTYTTSSLLRTTGSAALARVGGVIATTLPVAFDTSGNGIVRL